MLCWGRAKLKLDVVAVSGIPSAGVGRGADHARVVATDEGAINGTDTKEAGGGSRPSSGVYTFWSVWGQDHMNMT